MTIWHCFLAQSHVTLTILHLYFCKDLSYTFFSLPYETKEHFFKGGWWSRAHIYFVSYFNTSGKEAPNSYSQNKNKNIIPKGISAEIFVARFWSLHRGHDSRVLIWYRRVRHQTAVAILTRCTHSSATEAACLSEKGPVFIDSPSSGICAGWLDWGETLLAPSLTAFTAVVHSTSVAPILRRVKGGSMGSRPLLPLCLPPCPGELAKRGAEQGSPLGSLSTRGSPTTPVLAAEKGQLNIPPLTAWGGEEERAKEVMKAGGCCLWEEGLARVNAKGCWLLVVPHTLTDSF